MRSPMRRTTMRRARAATVAAALTVSVLAGCGDQTEDPASSVDTSHNEADVVFASGMIPHHAQALEMVEMAQERELEPEVEELVTQIQEAQEPEIETMTGWLEAWEEEVPDVEGMSAEDMGEEMQDMEGTEGMMSEMSMRQLRNAPDTAFEDVWLSLMIAHHQGAVTMAETQIAEGENEDAVALAEEIKASQSAEIEAMKALVGR